MKVFVLVWLPFLAYAQVGTDGELPVESDKCECTPPCEGVGSAGCPEGRRAGIPREDCDCCKVCLGQQGDECHLPNAPCDEELGLTCKQGFCEAEIPCKLDNECPDNRYCLGNACVDPCPVLLPCTVAAKGTKCVTRDHKPICECPEGTRMDAENNSCVKGDKECETKISGEEFYRDNCSSVCSCTEEGQSICSPLQCPHGLFPAGHSNNESNCIELNSAPGTSECCVIVICAKKDTPSDLVSGRSLDGETKLTDNGGNINGDDGTRNSEDRNLQRKLEALEEVLNKKKTSSANTFGTKKPHKELNRAKPADDNAKILSKDETAKSPELSIIHDDLPQTTDDNISLSHSQVTAIPELLENSTHLFAEKESFEIDNNTEKNNILSKSEDKRQEIEREKEGKQDGRFLKKVVNTGENIAMLEELFPRTKYTLKWVGSDSYSTSAAFTTEDGCRHDGISYSTSAKWHEGCQTTCVCKPGGKSDCQPRCIFVSGDITDPLCSEEPSSADPECCVTYNCKKSDNNISGQVQSTSSSTEASLPLEEEPKLIITSKSQKSVSVAWEDFSRSSDSSYVTEYRAVSDTDTLPWMKKTVPKGDLPPTMIIQPLKPNTLYEVRVSIYSNSEDERLVESTETVTVRTEAGCVYGNTSYPVGEFHQGCKEKCVCNRSGSVICSERCTVPYFRKGSFANDPLCVEYPTESDECCVIVACAQSEPPESAKGNPCVNVACGPNAECSAVPDLTQDDGSKVAHCDCKEGFIGDPKDLRKGCVKIGSESKCTFKNTTYQPGDVFNDDCEYTCTCSANNELDCQPRCQPPFDSGKKIEPGCTYEPVDNDACCKLKICNTTSTEERASFLPIEGCIKDNKTYVNGETFTDKCNRTCICMGYGDVSCENNSYRCPPTQLSPKGGLFCETLPDPEDLCCSITICDEKALDVQKENAEESLTTEESIATTTLPEVVINIQEEVAKEETTDIEGKEESKDMVARIMSANIPQKSIREHVTGITDDMMRNMTEREKEIVDDMTQLGELMLTNLEKLHIEMKINLTETEKEIGRMNITEEEKQKLLEKANESIRAHMITNTTDFEQSMMDRMSRLEKEIRDLRNISDADQEAIFRAAEKEKQELEKIKNLEEDALSREPNATLSSEYLTDSVLETLGEFLFDPIANHELRISKTTALDLSTIRISVTVSDSVIRKLLSSSSPPIVVQYSLDSQDWKEKKIHVTEIEVDNLNDIIFNVSGLEEGQTYKFRVLYEGISSPVVKSTVLGIKEVEAPDLTDPKVIGKSENATACIYKGLRYDAQEEFYDKCINFCYCAISFKVHCSPIKCPDMFALDLYDPDCMEWDYESKADLKPPNCCPKVECKARSTCTYAGQEFRNHQTIPRHLTGCSKECNCFYGNVTCVDLCDPVSPTPPQTLPCASQDAVLVTQPGETCCRSWQCAAHSISGPPSLFPHDTGPFFPGDHGFFPVNLPGVHPSLNAEQQIRKPEITQVKNDTIQLHFETPYIFNGLPANLYVRYTKDAQLNSDPLSWETQDILPPGHLLTRNEWEYDLTNLIPDELYSMQIVLKVTGVTDEIKSRVFTHHVENIVDVLYIDGHLRASEINKATAKISWGPFTKLESKYFDGVQVKYTEKGAYLPVFTRVFHRNNLDVILRDLKPGTEYTIELHLHDIPDVPNKPLLNSTSRLVLETKPEDGISPTLGITVYFTSFFLILDPKDPYVFKLEIIEGKTTSQSTEIHYSGFSEPEEKFIYVYNVMYQPASPKSLEKEPFFKFFKVPKSSEPRVLFLTDLKPSIKYEVWVEAFLTNGRKVISNVIDVKTDAGVLPVPERTGIENARENVASQGKDYYAALVAVAILAAVACLIILVLLMLLRRRQIRAKANLNSSHKPNTSAYDNPSYKVGDDSYDIEMNGLRGNTNGNTRMEAQ